MIILGIETSCDETATAVVLKDQDGIQILSNVIASSAKLQDKYGGIIPEQAAREQLKLIIPIITEALNEAKIKPVDLDAIAVTDGPGLIGSLLVGVETAKTLSLIWKKPLIPVNHLLGHFFANWIDLSNSRWQIADGKKVRDHKPYAISHVPTFPCIGLLVSGGHTDLILFRSENKYEYLGGTRDDAAGECFDKSARLIGYPYPGGPKISKIAEKGNPKAFKLPRPMIGSGDFDFSFSGLKTAFANLVAKEFKVTSIDSKDAQKHWKHIVLEESRLEEQEQLLADMCASVEQAIIDTLVKKAVKAAQVFNIEQIIVAGGVAANRKLTETLRAKFTGEIFTPPPYLCTDNAAMIAARGFFDNPIKDPLELEANPNLSLSY